MNYRAGVQPGSFLGTRQPKNRWGATAESERAQAKVKGPENDTFWEKGKAITKSPCANAFQDVPAHHGYGMLICLSLTCGWPMSPNVG